MPHQPKPVKRYINVIAPALFIFGLSALAVKADDTIENLKSQYKRPPFIPFPEKAPYSPQVATLGKMLFFDPRSSGMQHMSCASCHNPSFGFEVPVPGAIGSANKPLPRKAPTVLNAAWLPVLFWDGRAPDLETQAQGPITAEVEMDGKFPEIVSRLKNIPEYKAWFGKLFPRDGDLTGILDRAN